MQIAKTPVPAGAAKPTPPPPAPASSASGRSRDEPPAAPAFKKTDVDKAETGRSYGGADVERRATKAADDKDIARDVAKSDAKPAEAPRSELLLQEIRDILAAKPARPA